ncbi:MAG: hypothetical protein PHO08_13595 [Methylococcales bacterium]|nr:hypothetical protein [Methylococcales bacterium]
MGIQYADVKNLVQHFRPKSEGKLVITLGRLSVALHNNEIALLKKLFIGDKVAIDYLESYQWGDYSERFFKDLFKCSEVDSLDFSAYQDATIIHDLQKPISKTLYGKYDLVYDGGTLEHIFNFPIAIANTIHLARIDGLVYTSSPSNNLSGHGFYQFSPELMFRVMNHDNGMEVIMNRIGVARFPSTERTSRHLVYDVVDPDSVNCRVGLLSSRPVYMMVISRKINEVELFTQPILQSDYVKTWDNGFAKPAIKSVMRSTAKRIFDRLPTMLRRYIIGCYEIYIYSRFNRQFYRRVW